MLQHARLNTKSKIKICHNLLTLVLNQTPYDLLLWDIKLNVYLSVHICKKRKAAQLQNKRE